MQQRVRHIIGLSGGKDSTGLVIILSKYIPNLEYFFCDTGKELPETYEYLTRIETQLGISINRLSSERDFDFWLETYLGYLPSAQSRWCTRQLKLKPLENFVGTDVAYSYVGIRADEDRQGYIGFNNNIKPVYFYKASDYKADYLGKTIYDQQLMIKELKSLGIDLPIRESGFDISDVKKVIENSGIGMPKYYEWRTRSGCFFCFFQRKYEWIMLAERHPDLFKQAAKYEKINPDGTRYTWGQGETLDELLERKEEIICRHKRDIVRKMKDKPNQTLSEVFSDVLDDEDLYKPCLMCTL